MCSVCIVIYVRFVTIYKTVLYRSPCGVFRVCTNDLMHYIIAHDARFTILFLYDSLLRICSSFHFNSCFDARMYRFNNTLLSNRFVVLRRIFTLWALKNTNVYSIETSSVMQERINRGLGM